MKNQVKKITVFLVALTVMVVCCSCAKLTNTEQKTVDVTITDSRHTTMYVTPIVSGKVTTMITHPATWNVSVQYDGNTYRLSGHKTYDLCSDHIGESAKAILETKYYDDGTIRNDIISIDSIN